MSTLRLATETLRIDMQNLFTDLAIDTQAA